MRTNPCPRRVQAANKELSAKLASQTQRMELLVSQSMLAAAAAAAAGTAQGIPDAESPLVKAVSSSQGEGEQAQQLMLLRSPSRNVAAMASPGSGRLANETGQLEYLDEGDEVRGNAGLRCCMALCSHVLSLGRCRDGPCSSPSCLCFCVLPCVMTGCRGNGVVAPPLSSRESRGSPGWSMTMACIQLPTRSVWIALT